MPFQVFVLLEYSNLPACTVLWSRFSLKTQLWEVNMIKGILSQIQMARDKHFKPVYRVEEVSYGIIKLTLALIFY